MAINFTPLNQAGLNDVNFTSDGVDRSTWQFDEKGFDARKFEYDKDGFAIARDQAKQIAERQVIMAADDLNREVIARDKPSTATREIDGQVGKPWGSVTW